MGDREAALSESKQDGTWEVLERVDVVASSFSLSGVKKGVPSTTSMEGTAVSPSPMPSTATGGSSNTKAMNCWKPTPPSTPSSAMVGKLVPIGNETNQTVPGRRNTLL